jgi:hypothetical protein
MLTDLFVSHQEDTAKQYDDRGPCQQQPGGLFTLRGFQQGRKFRESSRRFWQDRLWFNHAALYLVNPGNPFFVSPGDSPGK